jgi:hypothetical protein
MSISLESAVVTFAKIMCWLWSGESEKIKENLSGKQAPHPRFEPFVRTSKSHNHYSNLLGTDFFFYM